MAPLNINLLPIFLPAFILLSTHIRPTATVPVASNEDQKLQERNSIANCQIMICYQGHCTGGVCPGAAMGTITNLHSLLSQNNFGFTNTTGQGAFQPTSTTTNPNCRPRPAGTGGTGLPDIAGLGGNTASPAVSPLVNLKPRQADYNTAALPTNTLTAGGTQQLYSTGDSELPYCDELPSSQGGLGGNRFYQLDSAGGGPGLGAGLAGTTGAGGLTTQPTGGATNNCDDEHSGYGSVSSNCNAVARKKKREAEEKEKERQR